jgi:hypothetical protein
MHRATTKAFAGAKGTTGTDTELANCDEPVYKALGDYTAGKSWRNVISDKTVDCSLFLMKSALDKDNPLLSMDMSKMCAGVPDAGGAAKAWAPVKLLLWCIFLLGMSAMLA